MGIGIPNKEHGGHPFYLNLFTVRDQIHTKSELAPHMAYSRKKADHYFMNLHILTGLNKFYSEVRLQIGSSHQGTEMNKR